MVTSDAAATDHGQAIAIIGMACRFPGADSTEAFWQNLAGGVGSVTRFPPVPVPGTRADGEARQYTPARGLLTDPGHFDAGYFGYSPRDARLISPQQRLFLECAAQAVEDAGQDPARSTATFGIYGGGTENGYGQILRERRHELPGVTDWDILLGTASDYQVSRVAYKLGFTGPSVAVQAACSTSLVAVHLAVRGLLGGDCDIALAGAAAVHVPDKESQYTPGGIISARGECRAFDADADGTVGGDGVGVVVLKRLADAQADGDRILAVLRGSAVNNDGAHRVGYTAPSVEGQTAVIREAQLLAGTDADSIGYVEAHGTATPLGDPIELAALTAAFRRDTDRSGYCWIGSVKTNIGHTDAAAGIAGLIKTVLALQHRSIPPSLNYEKPNPLFDFGTSPFRVATGLVPWPATQTPRRAAVSAFGIGGTNAHVILEEAPSRPAPAPAAPHQLLVLSARTPQALGEAAARLADRLSEEPPGILADVAWTLQTGRREHEQRAYAVAGNIDDAVRALTGIAAGPPTAKTQAHGDTVFLFTGAPGKRPSRSLYEAEPAYREAADACFAAAGLSGAACFGPPHPDDDASARVAAFVHDYAMAMTWIRWGVRPASVLATGEGVAVAAAVTKVLTVPGALRLTATGTPADGAARARDARTVEGYAALFGDAGPRAPRVPLISPVLGRALTGQEAADPLNWARAALVPDQDALERVLSALPADPHRVLLDISAGHVLPAATGPRPEQPRPDTAGPDDDLAAALGTLGALWAAGRPVRWRHVHGGSPRALLPLPTYPFQRERFVVEPVDKAQARPAEGQPPPAADVPQDAAPGEVLPTLLRLYADILGFAEVGPTDSFFDLGGDSLIASRLTARIREVYPVDVDVLSVFEAPEPAELAAVIEDLLAP
ncbi:MULTISPECIES: beta-ketoacyl synthase N-terminal-like domain-containing protein [Streptomyces]|uniref:type I polyketide synthase n=1 Tax=Streptomyces TaxID=1883 RepID=UPI0004C5590E|nr:MULTISPECIES: beta-ketoacyl synthase N-terminal-like domain-containing protein [Streptomyces]RPK84168.1 Phthiocerol/phenolphthiocerol synthesis polyketide synthase type I PpsE [Streptomyces sp. ADI98-10]